ncbi:MAG: DNA polymerase III subunit delta [Bacteroidota bacterium]|jgi:DNA polymerase-3 subunit delta
MPQRKFEELIADIRKKKFSPVYFLQGEEPYFIDLISKEIEMHCLEEFERDFNQTICYGKDSTLQHILNTCKRFPMMAERQLVVVREAQDMKEIDKPQKAAAGNKGPEVNPLEEYITKPTPSTVLVFCYKYKKIDGRSKLSKLVASHTELFQSEKLRDYKVASWIVSYAKEKNLQISEKTAQLISDHLGNDLSKTVNELDKLLIANNNNARISEADVLKFIGISKEFNAFEFSDALMYKNDAKAMQIAHYFAANSRENPLVKIIPALYYNFSRLLKMQSMGRASDSEIVKELGIPPMMLEKFRRAGQFYSFRSCMEVVSILHTYDLKAKGVDSAGTSDGELMREMTGMILYNA